MNEPPPLVLTSEEIGQAKDPSLVGWLIFAGLVCMFQRQHWRERERERMEQLAGSSPVR